MAKRKRLTPTDIKTSEPGTVPAPEAKSVGQHPLGAPPAMTRRPPIAQVAGDAAAQAALDEVAGELRAAKAEGRMVQLIDLAAIDVDHLMRDRMVSDADDMDTLKTSLKARGQQTPIEVVDLGQGRFGLISGWRRMAAFRALLAETGDDRFARIQCLTRQLDTVSDAYVSMVEENEIRVGLSYYERARVAARAAEQGVYPTAQLAVRDLFASASRAKRSKIMSFVTIYEALDDALKFPATMSERFGLKLAKALKDDPRLEKYLRVALVASSPADAAAEQAALATGLEPPKPAKAPPDMIAGIALATRPGHLTLSGAAVTEALVADLKVWLQGKNL